MIKPMPQSFKNFIHLLSGIAAVLFYRYPARRLTVIGVTGTDGKTTTISLIYHLLTKAGFKSAMITTVGAKIGDKDYDNGFHVTTPDAWTLQKYLRQAVKDGVTHVALEVSSHSIDQHRVVGIPFRMGVLTNITHEHLDYHHTYENYLAIKAKLLQRARLAIINRDDSSYEFLVKILRPERLSTYALHSPEAGVTPVVFPFTTRLIGEFNRYNALAAITAVRELGVDEEVIRDALLSFAPPEGRQKVLCDKKFKVIIDFAHTPNAFGQILAAVRAITPGRLIHVFGCAGKRDVSKRPLMGAMSAKYADVIIVTAEDPRGEPMDQIMKQITVPIKDFMLRTWDTLMNDDSRVIIREDDRRIAIQEAINFAQPGDTVLLTGKSHEKSMNYDGGKEEPWDETAEAQEALKMKGIV
jgi:UDP-N-acetylmuramoyl-L-alanyl-D-glutamate--2,6-diaminopimelate ligase